MRRVRRVGWGRSGNTQLITSRSRARVGSPSFPSQTRPLRLRRPGRRCRQNGVERVRRMGPAPAGGRLTRRSAVVLFGWLPNRARPNATKERLPGGQTRRQRSVDGAKASNPAGCCAATKRRAGSLSPGRSGPDTPRWGGGRNPGAGQNPGRRSKIRAYRGLG